MSSIYNVTQKAVRDRLIGGFRLRRFVVRVYTHNIHSARRTDGDASTKKHGEGENCRKSRLQCNVVVRWDLIRPRVRLVFRAKTKFIKTNIVYFLQIAV